MNQDLGLTAAWSRSHHNVFGLLVVDDFALFI